MSPYQRMKMAERLLQNGKVNIKQYKTMVSEARKLLLVKNVEKIPVEKLASPVPEASTIEAVTAESQIISSINSPVFQNDSFYGKLIAVLNRMDEIHKNLAITFYSSIGWKRQANFWMNAERRESTNRIWQLIAQGAVATALTVAIVVGVGPK